MDSIIGRKYRSEGVPGQVFPWSLAKPNHASGEARYRNKKLDRGGCARESTFGLYLLSLRPVPLAMGSNEEEPLIAIARADDWVRECVLPKFGLGIGGEFSGALANGLEFWEQLVVRPPARGHQALRACHAGRAALHPSHEVVVAHGGIGGIRRSLQSLFHVAEEYGFDHDDVLEAFGDGPAIRRRLVLELCRQEPAHGAEQALARLSKVGCGAFALCRCQGTAPILEFR